MSSGIDFSEVYEDAMSDIHTLFARSVDPDFMPHADETIAFFEALDDAARATAATAPSGP